ncbi:zinc finger CCHC domain-containing protein 17-like isoform X2 [Littorina saxatilis]
MSSARIEDPAEMLAKGEKVYCKVISVEAEGSKIGLSMKLVNQTTGKDLDPNNVTQSLDERKRKQFFAGQKPPIELGAVYDTKCRSCGGHGHLAMDCFVDKGGKQYDLVPDLEDMVPSEPEAPPPDTPTPTEGSTHKKKKKKEKKMKKEKKRKKKHCSSSSESSGSEKERRREIREKRKRHHSNSSDSSQERHRKHKKSSHKHRS